MREYEDLPYDQRPDPLHHVTWYRSFGGQWSAAWRWFDMQVIPAGERGRVWFIVTEVDTGRVSGALVQDVDAAKARAEGIVSRYLADKGV
jgi:hypothetical protein